MNKFLAIITCFFISFTAKAQSTTFDNKPICLEQEGNWRKFSNGCVDSCNSNFDEFAICTQAITYGCDCGPSRCWQNNKCVDKEEAKKEFQKKQEEKAAQLKELRAKRIEAFYNDPAYAYHIRNLYPKPVQNTEGKKGEAKVVHKVSKNEKVIVSKEAPKTPEIIVKPIPPAYMQKQAPQPINSNGKAQDLAFPVIELPSQ